MLILKNFTNNRLTKCNLDAILISMVVEVKIKLVLGSSESAFLRLLDQVLKVTTGSRNASLRAFAHILSCVSQYLFRDVKNS